MTRSGNFDWSLELPILDIGDVKKSWFRIDFMKFRFISTKHSNKSD